MMARVLTMLSQEGAQIGRTSVSMAKPNVKIKQRETLGADEAQRPSIHRLFRHLCQDTRLLHRCLVSALVMRSIANCASNISHLIKAGLSKGHDGLPHRCETDFGNDGAIRFLEVFMGWRSSLSGMRSMDLANRRAAVGFAQKGRGPFAASGGGLRSRRGRIVDRRLRAGFDALCARESGKILRGGCLPYPQCCSKTFW